MQSQPTLETLAEQLAAQDRALDDAAALARDIPGNVLLHQSALATFNELTEPRVSGALMDARGIRA
jgi:hypothetical protein